MQYYVRFTAEGREIIVSCEMPIQWEQSCLVCIRNTCTCTYTLYSLFILQYSQVYMGPAGACIPVANVSPIQYVHVLKHCGAHKHSLYYMYRLYTEVKVAMIFIN